MAKCRLLTLVFIFSLFLAAHAEDSSKILIADGAQYYSSISLYGDEANGISLKLKNISIRLPDVSPSKEDNYYIYSPVKGNFIAKDTASKAYLFTACDKDAACKYQGVIIIRADQDVARNDIVPQAVCIFPYVSDGELISVPDVNGNGLDEIAIINQKQGASSFRLFEFLSNGVVSLGKRELYGIDAKPAFRSKLYFEKGSGFFEQRDTITAKGWTPQPIQKIALDEDNTPYVNARKKNGILKHLSFFTFVTQAIAFIGLLLLVIYEFFISDISKKEKEAYKKEREERRAGKTSPLTEDNLPKLDPINCQSCGAGVPLQEGEMTCPKCSTKTEAPENYFDVAKARGEIKGKIRSAAIYLRRATILSSAWVRALTGLLALWLAISMIAVFVLSNRGNFEPYQSYIFSSDGFRAIGAFASFTNCFWVISLLMGFAIWSPSLKKTLPTVDFGEDIGKAENGNCPQCGGGIRYQPNDLATVCGYCGVETYRAKLAWKLRNLTNTADRKASFSLIEARKSAEDAIEDVIGTPKVLMFLLILAVILGLIMWLLSTGYDMLPDWLKGIFEIIGDILTAFS